jgi:hypothetical protein
MSQFEECEAGKYAYAIIDLVSRKWIASIVGPEATSTQVRVLFLKALEAEGLLTNEIRARLATLDETVPDGDADEVPLLLAVSDNGTEMKSRDTRKFLAACSIAQHFGRRSTPTDQAWIETLGPRQAREPDPDDHHRPGRVGRRTRTDPGPLQHDPAARGHWLCHPQTTNTKAEATPSGLPVEPDSTRPTRTAATGTEHSGTTHDPERLDSPEPDHHPPPARSPTSRWSRSNLRSPATGRTSASTTTS